MSQRPFRFLHAANLELDRPVHGLTDVPDHLIDAIVDCPLQAAARLFDAAIDLRVSFLVLSGEIIDPQLAAPREINFLLDQFNRLADRDIAVYWAGSNIAAAYHWPAYVRWPTNVKMFSTAANLSFTHETLGNVLCRVIGIAPQSADSLELNALRPADATLLCIGLPSSDWNRVPSNLAGIHYWALGNSNGRHSAQDSKFQLHCPGTHQGRSPGETGPRSATLVTVDDDQRIKLRFIDTDAVRWESIKIAVQPSAGAGELEQLLVDRATKLREENASRTVFVEWNIACHGRLRTALRQESLANDLTTKLNTQFGQTSPIVWTHSIQAEMPDQTPNEWRDEKTLRSDFLKMVEEASSSVSARDSLLFFVPEIPDEIENQLTRSDLLPDGAAARRRVLQDATWLGAELLSPGEARP
jgi:exonuclease SbcD